MYQCSKVEYLRSQRKWAKLAKCGEAITHYATILALESKADESGTVATDAPPWVEDALTPKGLKP